MGLKFCHVLVLAIIREVKLITFASPGRGCPLFGPALTVVTVDPTPALSLLWRSRAFKIVKSTEHRLRRFQSGCKARGAPR